MVLLQRNKPEQLYISEVVPEYTRHRDLVTKTKFALEIKDDLYVIRDGIPTSKRVFKKGEVVNALLCVYEAEVENNYLTKVLPTVEIIVAKKGRRYIVFSETANTDCDTFINKVGVIPDIIINLIQQLRKDFLHIGNYKEFNVMTIE